MLVETPKDIPQGFVGPQDHVAITAGASTPQWLLEEVRASIEPGTKPGLNQT